MSILSGGFRKPRSVEIVCKRLAASVSLLVLMPALQACQYFTRPLERPVIEEKLNPSFLAPGEIGTLSLTPERRVVLVNFATNRFCAEAPTEVGTDLASFFTATAEADVPSEVKAKVAAIVAATSSNSVLNKRTQGMQLFLASAYFACQMYMNGAISDVQLMRFQTKAFNAAATLIEREIVYLYTKGEPTPYKPTVKPLDTTQIIKELLEEPKASSSTPSADSNGTSPESGRDSGTSENPSSAEEAAAGSPSENDPPGQQQGDPSQPEAAPSESGGSE